MKRLAVFPVVSLVLLLCVFGGSAMAAGKMPGTISGTVTDSVSEEGVDGVRVEAFTCEEDTPAGFTTTAQDGSYRLEPRKQGCYHLRYKSDGYVTSWYSEPQEEPMPSRMYLDAPSVDGIDIGLTPATSYITGRVVDAEGKPLAEVWAIALMIEEGSYSIADGLTDESGQFVIEAATGQYIILFEKSGYIVAINGGSWTDPVKLNVGLGDVKTGINATLVPGGRISGTVRDVEGVGVDRITVSVRGGDGPITSRTYRDGNYVIDGVPEGTFTIMFYDKSRIYEPQYYSGTLDPQEATPVEVAVPLETEGIDAILKAAGSISGWVTDSTGTGVADLSVFAVGIDNRAMSGYGRTDENGQYTIPGLLTGQYFVSFQKSDNLYQILFYPGVNNPKKAERVSVVASTETTGINLIMVAGNALSGTVSGLKDEALKDVFVAAYPVDDPQTMAGFGGTDEKGNYAVMLQPGEYIVRFSGVNGYLEQWSGGVTEREEAESILVTGDAELKLDMVLPLGGAISGNLSNRAGVPIVGIKVRAYDTGTGKRGGNATSDETGQYKVVGLATGAYTVVANGDESGYVKQTYTQPVEVSAPKEKTQINMVLSEGGGFAGQVTDESGQPLKGVDVDIYDPVTWREVADTETDETGAYRIGGLPVGNYGIRFEARDYIIQWYAGKTRRETADRVDVADTTIRSSYDVVLKKGVPLSGVVTDSAGFPISYAEVGIYADVDDEPIEEVHTGYDGRFTVKSLAPGSYRVRFGTEDHMPKWYGGAHRLEARSIDISNAGISDLDISLELSTDKVAGKMINAAGEKVGQAWMTVIDADTNQPVSDERICECSGKFKIPLPAGRYKLRVERYGKVYWYGGASLETAQVLNVDGAVDGLQMIIE